MKKALFILLLLLSAGHSFGQVLLPDWKNILQTNKFKVVKDKYIIPTKIITQIADTITNVANPKEKWDASCIPNGLPRIKLNWAATDGTNWIVCYTHGGHSAKTIYELISRDSTETIQNPGWKGETYKNFKAKYISGTLKKGSLY